MTELGKIKYGTLVLIILLLGLLSLFIVKNRKTYKQEAEHIVYIPMVINPQDYSILGVQVDGEVRGYESFLRPHRMYQSPARWVDIEATKGEYVFPSWLDYNMEIFKPNPVILGSKTVPEWARLWKDKQGSPPLPENYIDYANFIIAVIDRYHPYGIEIFNEPDVPTEWVDNATQYYYGAWVENGDYYGAGVRYGTMLNIIYPSIKLVYPNIKIIAGAIIGEKTSLVFLQGAVDAGLKADYISFHQYIYVKEAFPNAILFAEEIAKITDIPIMLTETNVVSNVDSDLHRIYQAEYIKYLKDAVPYSRIVYSQIYSMYGDWKYTALISKGIPTLSYYEWATP